MATTPPGVTLTLSSAQDPQSQLLPAFHPGVGFLPVDALRSLDRGPSPTAPVSWRPLPPENGPIPSVTSVLGFHAQCPPMYVVSGGALPSTTSTCISSGVVPSSLSLNRGLPSQIITHVSGGQWVIEESGSRDDRLPYHANAPTVILPTTFHYASGGATKNFERVMRPANEGTVSLPGRSVSQAENFTDQKPPTLLQLNSSSAGEPIGAVPVSSARPPVLVTRAAPVDAQLSDDFRKMFCRFLEEEVGKAADREIPLLEKETTGKVPTDGRTVPVQTCGRLLFLQSLRRQSLRHRLRPVKPPRRWNRCRQLVLRVNAPTNGDSS